MDKYAQLSAALQQAATKVNVVFTTAEVVSIQGDTCTVNAAGIEVDSVRLRATRKETDIKILITPAVGSYVLVGSLSGDWKEVAVLAVDVADSISVINGDFSAEIDARNGTFSISGNGVSLLDLFQQISDIVTNLKVNTPSGPSTGLLPDSLNALNTFQTDFKKLLK